MGSVERGRLEGAVGAAGGCEGCGEKGRGGEGCGIRQVCG